MANLSNINGKFVVEQTTGYVGVGTTDPNFLIEAAGANSEIALNSTSGSIYRLRSTSSDSFIITKNGVGDRLVIDGSGNSTFAGEVTISAETQYLNFKKASTADILSTIVSETDAGTGGKLRFLTKRNGDTQVNALILDDNQNATFAGNITAPGLVYNATNKYLSISHWSSPPPPAAILHLSDNANDIDVPQIRIEGRENPGDTRLDISVKDPDVRFNLVEGSTDASSGYGLMIFKTNAAPQASFPTRGGFNFQTPASSSSLFITNEANVGIGTSSPVGKLQVSLPTYTNEDTNSQQAIFGVDSGYGVRIGYNETDNKGYISVLKPGVAWGSLILQEEVGKVGIGTTSPQRPLHVNGTEGVARFTSTASGNNGFEVGIGVSSQAFLWLAENSHMEFATNNTERMRIGNAGKVTVFDNMSIGGFAGTAKLQVNSTVNAGGVSVAAFLVNSSITVGTEVRLAFAANTNDDIATGRYSYISTVNTSGSNGQAMTFATNISGASAVERMRITSTGAISVGSSGTAYGAAGEVLTSNGNASPSWQAAGGGGSAWPQEKFAVYTINSTTSNILIATMNSTTWHGNYQGGCLKFTINDTDYIQVSYVTVYTFLSQTNQWFFKGNTEMTTHNSGTNPFRYVFAFAGNLGSFGTTCTLKINRVSNGGLGPTNVLVQAISSPDMFILN